VAAGGGGGKGELVIEVGGKKVRIGYTLDKDTLTIVCKDRVPAGKCLGSYNISGIWERFKTTSK